MKGLEEYFNEMEDVRQKHKIKHLIGEILTIALCAVASGVETVYKNGLPSHDTIGRVLQIINPKHFQQMFIRWIEESLAFKTGSYIQIDGKTLKGNGLEDKKGIHLVSAYAHEIGVVLGQLKCEEKNK